MHSNKTEAPKKRAWALSAGLLIPAMIGMSANAQMLESSKTNWGTNRVFSYAVTTTYGTNISVDAARIRPIVFGIEEICERWHGGVIHFA